MSGNIYRRGATWWGRVWVRGVEHRRSLRTTDEAEAGAAVERWREELEAGVTSTRLTWEKAVVHWATMVAGDASIRASTRERYVSSLRGLEQAFGRLFLDEINRKAIGQYVATRRKSVTNATIRRDLSALSSVYRACAALGLVDTNPAREWDRSVIRQRKRELYVPTVEEIELVASAAPPWLAGLIRFAAYTGCRQNEAVGLQWRYVRLDRGEATLHKTKAGRARVIALRSPGGDATGTLTGTPRHIRSGVVFWREDGRSITSIKSKWRDLIARVCRENPELKRFRFHSMRHAFAIRWLEAGGDIYRLSRHLGHTSVATTEIYLQWVRHSDRHTAPGSEEKRAAGEG